MIPNERDTASTQVRVFLFYISYLNNLRNNNNNGALFCSAAIVKLFISTNVPTYI